MFYLTQVLRKSYGFKEVSVSQILKRPQLKIKQHGINTSFWVEEPAEILPLRSALHCKFSLSGDVGRIKKRFTGSPWTRRAARSLLLDRSDCLQQLGAEIWSNSAFRWHCGRLFWAAKRWDKFSCSYPMSQKTCLDTWLLKTRMVILQLICFSWVSWCLHSKTFSFPYTQYCVLQWSYCRSTFIWPKIPPSLLSDNRAHIYRAA